MIKHRGKKSQLKMALVALVLTVSESDYNTTVERISEQK